MAANKKCPNCGAYDTMDGSKLNNDDLLALFVGSIATVGTFALFWIPLMVARTVNGDYKRLKYRCHKCNNRWIEDQHGAIIANNVR